jgi:hypothetical protein
MRAVSGLRAAGALLLAAGCGVFTPNNRELLSAQARLVSGDAPGALAALDPHRRDDLPAKLDRATILSSVGRARESNDEFDRALAQIRGYESRAVVSAREVGRGTTSLVVNDKTLEYQGEGYEKVLIHTFKARNYLLLGDVEAALVEMRNANMRQDEERKKHQAEIDRGKRDTAGAGAGQIGGEIDRSFEPVESVLRRVRSPYQNPFATYLSGVVYELNGETDDAFIDYEAAYKMVPSATVGADLARLGARLHRTDALEPLGLRPPKGPATPPGNTLVVVDNGFAPHRVELKFPIPEPDTLLWVAVPMSQPVPTDLGETQILAGDGAVLGETQVLVDVEAMSVRDLRDRYPGIVARQLVRAAGKAAAAHAATDELGLGGFLLTTAFNAVTEQADLRSWYSLPRSIHVARVTLPEGTSEARLRFLGTGSAFMREFSAPVVRVTPRMNLVVVRYANGSVMASAPPHQGATADAGRMQ